ncbi:hypothetical protein CBR_g11154 [Chara braunii]|uniref:RRM domain-containing protein n=1 Tax=Chara braunii TaxID=69332 RepID=A0A388KQB2_CHABU|nr:hypothetical protein CBR_g11154 [Chara braunii]|eukprot:GBG72222.1 hypothetical protein CBR_g11154 [Chara braunii]
MGKLAKRSPTADAAGGAVADKKQERRKKKQVVDGSSSRQKGVGEETDRRGVNTGEDNGVTGGGVRETVVEVKVRKQRREADGDECVAAKKKKKTNGGAEAIVKMGAGEETDRQGVNTGEDKGLTGGGVRETVSGMKVRKQRRESGCDDSVAAKKKKKKKTMGGAETIVKMGAGEETDKQEVKKKKKKKVTSGAEAIVEKEVDANQEGNLARTTARKRSRKQEADVQGDVDKSTAVKGGPATKDAEEAMKKDGPESGLPNDKAGEEGETAAASAQSDGAIVLAERKDRKPRPTDFLPLDVERGDRQVAKKMKKKKGRQEDGALIPADGKPRVIFLSRVPHGFYEQQMLQFFGQFGTVTRLILSRNKKSGASRHYAFIEFRSPEVAAIVADCLHNYFIDGKILQCKLVSPEKVHPKTFFRANRVFKPWLGKKRHKAAHDRARNPEAAAKLLARLKKSDKKRREKLKAVGIDYVFQGYASLVPPKPKHVKFSEDDEPKAQES